MQPPSEPEINRDNPDKYFIFWNHDVPSELWGFYEPRRRIRIKVYDNINRYKGDEKEKYAEERRQVWKYKLEKLNYNPFKGELERLEKLNREKHTVVTAIEEIKVKKELSPEEIRLQTSMLNAFNLFLESRGDRTTNRNSVSTYGVTVRWITKYFEDTGRVGDPASSIKRNEVADALMTRKREKKWEPTTYNNELGLLITMFNWLAKEGYIESNPISDGKIETLKTQKHKHKWYDKETKELVKAELIRSNEMLVYNVMQTTYETFIRSKTELMKLKAGDIDRKLKRIRFSAELSKNNREAFRDYTPEFDELLDRIGFDSIPKNFYIFGRKGEPSEFKCHKDLFADRWRVVRERLGLDEDFSIYGMKHTRVVHELFKGTDGYEISYMARHEDPKSTKDYMRDYDITLRNKYGSEDLKF